MSETDSHSRIQSLPRLLSRSLVSLALSSGRISLKCVERIVGGGESCPATPDRSLQSPLLDDFMLRPKMPENDNEQKMNDTAASRMPSMDLTPLSRIGPVALECAEQIEREYGDSARVLSVVVVAEVLAQNERGEYINSIDYCSSENRRWIQLALLQQAVARAETFDEARIDEADGIAIEEDED